MGRDPNEGNNEGKNGSTRGGRNEMQKRHPLGSSPGWTLVLAFCCHPCLAWAQRVTKAALKGPPIGHLLHPHLPIGLDPYRSEAAQLGLAPDVLSKRWLDDVMFVAATQTLHRLPPSSYPTPIYPFFCPTSITDTQFTLHAAYQSPKASSFHYLAVPGALLANSLPRALPT